MNSTVVIPADNPSDLAGQEVSIPPDCIGISAVALEFEPGDTGIDPGPSDG